MNNNNNDKNYTNTNINQIITENKITLIEENEKKETYSNEIIIQKAGSNSK